MILRSNLFDKPVREIASLKEAVIAAGNKLDYRESYVIEVKAPPFMDREYRSKEFIYNPCRLTCSCEYNRAARQKYEGNDARKVCRHIYHKLQDKAPDLVDPLVMLILKQQLRRGPEFIVREKEDLFSGHIEGSPWISVYALREGRWRRFMYNAREKRYAMSGGI